MYKISGTNIYIRIVLLALILLSIFFITRAVQRDIIFKNDYTGDLRNRVVGSRLINDGKLPYYYKWKMKDGIRYYDPAAFNNGKLSNITASPFFHQLLIPFSNLPESEITDIWFCIEYCMFLIIVLIAVSFCDSVSVKLVVAGISIAFLYTDAWKAHIASGQLYLVIPFLTALFTFFLYRAKNIFYFFFCGILATMLVLIRPNFIFFFLPLLLWIKVFKMKNIAALVLPFCAALVWIFSNSFQLSLWKQYFAFVNEGIITHQGADNKIVVAEADPGYAVWEGITWKKVNKILPDSAIAPHSENGNFFVVYRSVFHKQINTATLFITGNALIILIFFFFYRQTKNKNKTADDLLLSMITGFCLYMISDLFSPVYRHQYYTIQWLFAVLLFFSIAKNKNERIFQYLTLAGVFLNMINVNFLKMEHTMGEYIVLFSLLLFSFAYYKRKNFEK